MSVLAVFLSLTLAIPARAQPRESAPSRVSTSTAPASRLAPIVITAPRAPSEEIGLKQTRAVGGVAAASGVGLMTYAVFFAGAGPVGWAAALLYFGGLSAYMSHRRLRGIDDLSPVPTARGEKPQEGGGAGGR